MMTKEGRTTYTLLFKDHCILLDLMEGTDRFFSGIIESYYGLEVQISFFLLLNCKCKIQERKFQILLVRVFL